MSRTPAAAFDREEVDRFAQMAARWWDPAGPMKPLHRINPVRLAYLKAAVCRHFQREPTGLKALEGLTILDIGCGGGLLCEPLARLGATVTGIEPATEAVDVARTHAAGAGLSVEYINGTADDLVAGGRDFDVVLAMEVVEHVPDLRAFCRTAASLVRPGGLFAGSTLNRTLRSFALAIVGAEYVLRWLPVGTHRWEKFVTPDEFDAALVASGLTPEGREGLVYNPLADRWSLAGDTAVNYFVTAGRPD